MLVQDVGWTTIFWHQGVFTLARLSSSCARPTFLLSLSEGGHFDGWSGPFLGWGGDGGAVVDGVSNCRRVSAPLAHSSRQMYVHTVSLLVAIDTGHDDTHPCTVLLVAPHVISVHAAAR